MFLTNPCNMIRTGSLKLATPSNETEGRHWKNIFQEIRNKKSVSLKRDFFVQEKGKK